MPTRNKLNGMVIATGHAVTQSRSDNTHAHGRIIAQKRPNHAARSIAAPRRSAHAKHAQMASEKSVTRRAKKMARCRNNQAATNVNSSELRARASC